MTAAGAVYASLENIAAAQAVPVVAAFLMLAALYWTSGFPSARNALARGFTPAQIAAGLTVWALAAYLVYSLPLGLFSWASLAKLSAVVVPAAWVFVVSRPSSQKLSWQDGLLLVLLAAPAVSGVTLYREIFPGIGEPVDRLDILGKLTAIGVGAVAFLVLRPLPDPDYRFSLRSRDLAVGFKWFLYYLPFAVPLALLTGMARFDPRPIDDPTYFLELLGRTLGIYLAVSLPEELCFRGSLQQLLEGRLGKPRVAQALAAILFGLVHVTFRFFPNWPHVLLSGVLGWFCGGAYREGRIPAAAVCHTLVVITWAFVFR